MIEHTSFLTISLVGPILRMAGPGVGQLALTCSASENSLTAVEIIQNEFIKTAAMTTGMFFMCFVVTSNSHFFLHLKHLDIIATIIYI